MCMHFCDQDKTPNAAFSHHHRRIAVRRWRDCGLCRMLDGLVRLSPPGQGGACANRSRHANIHICTYIKSKKEGEGCPLMQEQPFVAIYSRCDAHTHTHTHTHTHNTHTQNTHTHTLQHPNKTIDWSIQSMQFRRLPATYWLLCICTVLFYAIIFPFVAVSR